MTCTKRCVNYEIATCLVVRASQTFLGSKSFAKSIFTIEQPAKPEVYGRFGYVQAIVFQFDQPPQPSQDPSPPIRTGNQPLGRSGDIEEELGSYVERNGFCASRSAKEAMAREPAPAMELEQIPSKWRGGSLGREAMITSRLPLSLSTPRA